MKHTFRDAYAQWDQNALILGNRSFRRKLNLSGGCPRTVSLCASDGTEYAQGGKEDSDFYFAGINRPGHRGSEYEIVSIRADEFTDMLFDSPHLRVTLEIRDNVQKAILRREFFLYPEIPVHGMRNTLHSPVMPLFYWTFRKELVVSGEINRTRYGIEHLESAGDSIRLAKGFQVAESVEFTGRTDYTDNLVIRHDAAEQRELNGNLCYAESADGCGLFYLQEAPPSSERRDCEPYDFRIDGDLLVSCTSGIPPWEVRDVPMTGHRHILGLFHGKEERDRILKDYLALRFPGSEQQDSIMVNAWGCGRYPEFVSENFLMEEIRASKELGATHYQIDDSWQEGEGLVDLIVKNRYMTSDFWNISRKRLNGSFQNLLDAAEESGIKPALWTAPSANAEYRDWSEFAELLLDYHRRFGFEIFKIDGVLIRTHEAEENLRKLMRTVRERSEGTISFNLDTTNGQRPGYFMFLEYGNIFLENRYGFGGIGYHPEKTLRSLWQLAHYMRIQTLQVEIPYPGDVKEDFYAGNPHGDPRCYPLEYWAAIALFASPLLWLAPSRVAKEDRIRYRVVLDLYSKYGKEIASGRICPVGTEPDGHSICGFYSDSGYLIVYREKEAPPSAKLDIPDAEWKRIAGDGILTGNTISGMPPAEFALFSS